MCWLDVNYPSSIQPNNVDQSFTNLTKCTHDLFDSLKNVTLALERMGTNILCQTNTSRTFLSALNSTISYYSELNSYFNSLNASQIFLIENNPCKTIIDQVHGLQNLSELMTPLSDLLINVASTNEDLSQFVKQVNISLNNLKYLDTNASVIMLKIIPTTFNNLYDSFNYINTSFLLTNSFLNRINYLIKTISSWNGITLQLKCEFCISCNITYIYSQIYNISNVFQGINQISGLLDYQENICYFQFAKFRFQLYLMQNFNITSLMPFDHLNYVLTYLYNVLDVLNTLIIKVYSFKSMPNNLTSWIQIYKNYTIQIKELVSSDANIICPLAVDICLMRQNVTQTLDLLLNYSIIVFSFKHQPLPDFTTYPTLYTNASLSSTYLDNFKSILNSLFYTTENLNNFDYDFNKIALITQIAYNFTELADYCYNSSGYLSFISQLSNGNSVALRAYMNASLFLNQLSTYSSKTGLMFVNFTDFKNNRTFLSVFLNLTYSFESFINSTNLTQLSTDIGNRQLVISITNLNSSLLKIKNSLYYSITSSLEQNTWNEWQPWTTCIYHRFRRSMPTNMLYEESGSVSCSLISKI